MAAPYCLICTVRPDTMSDMLAAETASLWVALVLPCNPENMWMPTAVGVVVEESAGRAMNPLASRHTSPTPVRHVRLRTRDPLFLADRWVIGSEGQDAEETDVKIPA